MMKTGRRSVGDPFAGRAIVERTRKLYWITGRKGRKDMLVFDPGYLGGDVHLYIHEKSIASETIRKEVIKIRKREKRRETALAAYEETDVVGIWARRKGATLEWTVSK
jgi:hypothetical protein